MMKLRSLGTARHSGPESLLALGLVALVLSGCVASQRDGGQTTASGRANAGSYEVTVDGGRYQASLAAGRAGKALTRQGARPVQGYEVTVSRLGGRLAAHEGALAKKVLQAGCKEAKGRTNPTALGRYDRAGLWRFAGGCA